jgi:hypothetical protein
MLRHIELQPLEASKQRSIMLYHVDTNHAEDMLIAYLPQEKIVINADLYGPPPAGATPPNVNANAVASLIAYWSV